MYLSEAPSQHCWLSVHFFLSVYLVFKMLALSSETGALRTYSFPGGGRVGDKESVNEFQDW